MTLEMVSPLEVGIACRDLAGMRRFYEGVLGFRFISEYHVGAEKAAESSISAGGYTVVRMQTSNGERVKLLAPVQPVAPEAPSAFILDKPNAIYLTFIIEDINAAIAWLQDEGIGFMTGDKRVEVRPGVYLAYCRDPEGNVLELVQYQDITAYRSDLKKRNA